MIAARALFLFALPWSFAAAQPAPQFTWKGRVDGTVVIYLHRNSVEVEDVQGNRLPRQDFHFYAGLPDSRQEVRLEVSKNRGAVHISQQPRLENNYTAAVTIEDLQDGQGEYAFALYWKEQRGSLFDADPEFNRRPELEEVKWSGSVDGEAIVECRQKSCRAVTQMGARVAKERARFSRALPLEPVTLRLGDTQGRGDIRIIEQPSAQNGYTVRVLIRDRQAGAGEYAFVLAWERNRRRD